MKHSKYDEVHTLVKHNINVLLVSEAGTGKTTLLRQVAEDLGLGFCAVSMTRQTTLNSLLGFISINGTYIPSTFRDAVENGKMFLMDEIDSGDSNTVLALNTLENGFVAFPDKIVDVHPDFRWVATANPQDQHNVYTGRSKLDAATLDRFDIVHIERDPSLEVHITSPETVEEVTVMRDILHEMNASKTISMRDSLRLHKRKQLGLDTNYHKVLLGSDDIIDIYDSRLKTIEADRPIPLSECTTVDQLWDNLPEATEYTYNGSITDTVADTVPEEAFTQEYLQEINASVDTTVNTSQSTSQEDKDALHIARHFMLSGGIQSEYLDAGWRVEDSITAEDLYDKNIYVYSKNRIEPYVFNRKEIQL